MDRWVHGCKHGCGEWMDEWMHKRMTERMDEWDELMSGCVENCCSAIKTCCHYYYNDDSVYKLHFYSS
jgi:hypothetical protein